MTAGRRILLANVFLDSHTGTETHLRDHALEFMKRGHSVMVYAPRLGALADEIAAAGGEVRNSITAFSAPPDIVHGNHHFPLMRALLHFKDAPGVLCCHDATHAFARPTAFPRILRQAAVDWNCRERVTRTLGLREWDVSIVPNSVDMARFQPRTPLPVVPRRALVFSNYADENNYMPALRAACQNARLELSVAGAAMGNPERHPERILGKHDIVFAKARCALEALAVGCHVVLCDFRGLGPTITLENFSELRDWNFGARVLREKITPTTVASRIEKYAPPLSNNLRDKVRLECGVDRSADQWLAVYEDVIKKFQVQGKTDPAEEKAVANHYCAGLYQEIDMLSGSKPVSLLPRLAKTPPPEF